MLKVTIEKDVECWKVTSYQGMTLMFAKALTGSKDKRAGSQMTMDLDCFNLSKRGNKFTFEWPCDNFKLTIEPID